MSSPSRRRSLLGTPTGAGDNFVFIDSQSPTLDELEKGVLHCDKSTPISRSYLESKKENQGFGASFNPLDDGHINKNGPTPIEMVMKKLTDSISKIQMGAGNQDAKSDEAVTDGRGNKLPTSRGSSNDVDGSPCSDVDSGVHNNSGSTIVTPTSGTEHGGRDYQPCPTNGTKNGVTSHMANERGDGNSAAEPQESECEKKDIDQNVDKREHESAGDSVSERKRIKSAWESNPKVAPLISGPYGINRTYKKFPPISTRLAPRGSSLVGAMKVRSRYATQSDTESTSEKYIRPPKSARHSASPNRYSDLDYVSSTTRPPRGHSSVVYYNTSTSSNPLSYSSTRGGRGAPTALAYESHYDTGSGPPYSGNRFGTSFRGGPGGHRHTVHPHLPYGVTWNTRYSRNMGSIAGGGPDGHRWRSAREAAEVEQEEAAERNSRRYIDSRRSRSPSNWRRKGPKDWFGGQQEDSRDPSPQSHYSANYSTSSYRNPVNCESQGSVRYNDHRCRSQGGRRGHDDESECSEIESDSGQVEIPVDSRCYYTSVTSSGDSGCPSYTTSMSFDTGNRRLARSCSATHYSDSWHPSNSEGRSVGPRFKRRSPSTAAPNGRGFRHRRDTRRWMDHREAHGSVSDGEKPADQQEPKPAFPWSRNSKIAADLDNGTMAAVQRINGIIESRQQQMLLNRIPGVGFVNQQQQLVASSGTCEPSSGTPLLAFPPATAIPYYTTPGPGFDWLGGALGNPASVEQGSGYLPPSLSNMLTPSGRRPMVPVIHVDPNGIITIQLHKGICVELTLDKTIRILAPDKFSAAVNNRATMACIMHPSGRIYQQDTTVFAHFGEDKMSLIGTNGILFTMKGQEWAYLVSSSQHPRGTRQLEASTCRFPSCTTDYTKDLLHKQASSHVVSLNACNEVVRHAYFTSIQGEISVDIMDMSIRQRLNGDVEILASPRKVHASPTHGTVSIQTHYVDMGVLEDDQAYVKRGVKRVHVSPSGMVVSDGQCTASIDFFGHIVSSST